MRKSKVQNKSKNHTKSTETIRKLKDRLIELEKEVKRLKLELSWHEDKNNYTFAMIESSLEYIDKHSIPF